MENGQPHNTQKVVHVEPIYIYKGHLWVCAIYCEYSIHSKGLGTPLATGPWGSTGNPLHRPGHVLRRPLQHTLQHTPLSTHHPEPPEPHHRRASRRRATRSLRTGLRVLSLGPGAARRERLGRRRRARRQRVAVGRGVSQQGCSGWKHLETRRTGGNAAVRDEASNKEGAREQQCLLSVQVLCEFCLNVV